VPNTSERTLLFLVGAVQFVNVLDFMMVMPLGPDFAAALGIPASNLGLVGGAYTAAAAVAGLLGATFLDRFDRRSALAVAMSGLVVATAAGGLATGLPSMVAARIVAGAFGGPATALSLSIVADAVPVERRGKAIGAVMGAFAVSSVLGVPAGLELARLGGWRTPFFAVASMGLLVAGSALRLMPSMRGHLDRPPAPRLASGATLFRRPAALLALSATAVTMMSNFSIVPNIAAHLQYDLGFPRERLGLMYALGGAVAFFVLRVAGRAVDRFGEARVAAAGTGLFLFVLAFGFAYPAAWLPVPALFIGFMGGNSIRSVAMQNVSSRVPAPHERARFMSTQSAVQHLASAIGAVLSTRILTQQPDGRLGGMTALSGFSGALALALPFLLGGAAALLRRDAGAARSAQATAAGAAPAAGVAQVAGPTL
jgi:predicted MFS family arabinose efflux permease